jgi:hypothetical protein
MESARDRDEEEPDCELDRELDRELDLDRDRELWSRCNRDDLGLDVLDGDSRPTISSLSAASCDDSDPSIDSRAESELLLLNDCGITPMSASVLVCARGRPAVGKTIGEGLAGTTTGTLPDLGRPLF